MLGHGPDCIDLLPCVVVRELSAHLHSSGKRVLTFELLQPEDSGMRVRYRLLFRQQYGESTFAPPTAGISIVLDTPRCDA